MLRFNLLIIILVSTLSCGLGRDNSIAKPPTPTPVSTPTINSTPTYTTEQIKKGEQIFKNTIKRFRFDYQKPIMSGICVGVVVPFPMSEWKRLSKKDRVNLALFAENVVADIKQAPEKYIEMPESAPLYATCRQNAAKMCLTCWRIEAGSVVTIDGDTNIGPDSETVIDGKTILEFRNSNEN
jgi:hypothetical protein